MLIADLVPAVAVEAPGCPELMIERVLRTEIRQLYRSHRLWLHRDAAASVDTNGTVTVTKPDNSEIVEIRHLKCADWQVEPRTVEAYGLVDFVAGETPAVAGEVNGVWKVAPAPLATTAVEVLMQLAPIRTAASVDDVVANRHEPLYHHLALARILAMPQQTWSAAGVASYHISESIRLIADYKRRIDGWTSVRTPVVRYGGI